MSDPACCVNTAPVFSWIPASTRWSASFGSCFGRTEGASPRWTRLLCFGESQVSRSAPAHGVSLWFVPNGVDIASISGVGAVRCFCGRRGFRASACPSKQQHRRPQTKRHNTTSRWHRLGVVSSSPPSATTNQSSRRDTARQENTHETPGRAVTRPDACRSPQTRACKPIGLRVTRPNACGVSSGAGGPFAGEDRHAVCLDVFETTLAMQCWSRHSGWLHVTPSSITACTPGVVLSVADDMEGVFEAVLLLKSAAVFWPIVVVCALLRGDLGKRSAAPWALCFGLALHWCFLAYGAVFVNPGVLSPR